MPVPIRKSAAPCSFFFLLILVFVPVARLLPQDPAAERAQYPFDTDHDFTTLKFQLVTFLILNFSASRLVALSGDGLMV